MTSEDIMTSLKLFSTADIPMIDRATQWNAAIADTYFPLHLHFHDPLHFQGQLSSMELGGVGLSRLVSSPVNYERHRIDIKHTQDEEYLITIPKTSSIEFRQLGKTVKCDPGGFIIQRGEEPYRFMYKDPNDLFVMKIKKASLSERLRQPDRFCSNVVDATNGCANLFTNMVMLAQEQGNETKHSSLDTVGRHLIELLGLALEEQPNTGMSNSSSVRAAHISRVDQFIRANLNNPKLSPDLISSACCISKRYLHDLFKDVNGTVCQHIRDQRLIATRDLLAQGNEDNIADLAYRFGFSDHAQFSRLFKAKFGMPPSQFRAQFKD